MIPAPAFRAEPEAAAYARLFAELEGHVLLPRDPEYLTRLGVWNAAVKELPAVIVRPKDTPEVAACVRFARARGLPIAIRSGGHSPAGFGTGIGMVIDLSRMKDIRIDPDTRIARLETGLVWREVAKALHPHGLAITSGDVGSVGVGGLTQGGGIGWFVRKHGLTIDRLRSAELVTADGEILEVSERRRPDLFWALRGAGANLGVVTRLDVEAHAGGMVLGGAVFYDASDPATAAALFAGYAAIARCTSDDLSTQANLMAAPPAPFVPADAVGRPVLGVLVCWSGELAAGERAVAPLRALGTPIADLIGPMPYPAMFALTEEASAPGFRHAVRSQFLRAFDHDVASVLAGRTLDVLNPGTLVQVRVLGGAMSRVPRDATAFAHRDASHLLLIDNFAPDEGGEDAATSARAATDHIWNGVRERATGAYGNFLGVGEEGRVMEAYDAPTLDRIARIKAQVDPENVFRRNLNVAPRAGGGAPVPA